MKDVKDSKFKNEVIESDIPVVIDFWAPWCGPCRMVSPIMEDLDKQYSGKIKFVKVNIDKNPITSKQYGISSIPTIMLFKGGRAVESMVGFKPKSTFEQIINKYV